MMSDCDGKVAFQSGMGYNIYLNQLQLVVHIWLCIQNMCLADDCLDGMMHQFAMI